MKQIMKRLLALSFLVSFSLAIEGQQVKTPNLNLPYLDRNLPA